MAKKKRDRSGASTAIEVKHATGTAVPDEWMFELFNGGVAVDYAVSGARALEVPAVASAISLISGSIASLDMVVERREGDSWVAAPEHSIATLLRDAPNDWSDWWTLIRDLVASALTDNAGALAWINRRDGEPVELVHYAKGAFTIDYSHDGRNEPSYRIGDREVPQEDVLHLRGPFAKCPLSLAAGAIGVAHALERHAGNLFSKGARPAGFLSFDKRLTPEVSARVGASWRASQEGVGNSAKTPVLEEGGTFHTLAFKSVDAQFLETWRHAILEIGRHFRVPPGALYDFERQTWSNMESAQKEWPAGLEFWLRPLEGSMRRALFSPEDRRTHRIRFDRDDFTAVDLTARATAVSSLIASRVINPNEARDWLGMGPREGGQAFENPHTGSNQPGAAAPQPLPEERP